MIPRGLRLHVAAQRRTGRRGSFAPSRLRIRLEAVRGRGQTGMMICTGCGSPKIRHGLGVGGEGPPRGACAVEDASISVSQREAKRADRGRAAGTWWWWWWRFAKIVEQRWSERRGGGASTEEYNNRRLGGQKQRRKRETLQLSSKAAMAATGAAWRRRWSWRGGRKEGQKGRGGDGRRDGRMAAWTLGIKRVSDAMHGWMDRHLDGMDGWMDPAAGPSF